MGASAPVINGEFWENYHDQSARMGASGAFRNSTINTAGVAANGGAATPRGWTFDASRTSSIYGASDTIRPVSKEVRFMVKY